jgi:hypothetical protein
MREFVRPVATAFSIACLAASMPILSSTGAMAQGKQQMAPKQMAPAAPAQPPAVKQMALTEKQVEGVIAAGKEMDPIVAKIQPNAKPDPKATAQLEAIAKKNGFASYDDYENVSDNIVMVFNGIDPSSKKYVGDEAVIKAQIAEVTADKKMSPKDKKEALADLNDSLKTPGPTIENKGNIDLVIKYYDKLAAEIGGGQK